MLRSEGVVENVAEKEVFRGHPAKMSCLKDLVLGVLLLPILIGLYFLGRALVRIYSTTYIITDRRIVVKTGVFSIRSVEIRIFDVRGVFVARSLWQRIIGVGTVSVGTAATVGTEINMVDVSNPQQVVAVINSLRN